MLDDRNFASLLILVAYLPQLAPFSEQYYNMWQDSTEFATDHSFVLSLYNKLIERATEREGSTLSTCLLHEHEFFHNNCKDYYDAVKKTNPELKVKHLNVFDKIGASRVNEDEQRAENK